MKLQINAFGGLVTDVEPHLLKKGQFSAMENLRTDTGAIKTRPGFSVQKRADAADSEKWPYVLWSRGNPVPTAGRVRNVNQALICAQTALASPEVIDE